MLRTLGVSLLSSFFAFTTFASQYNSLEPVFGGSACNGNNPPKVIMDEETKTMRIEVPNYHVRAGGPDGQEAMVKSCNIAIPIKVPKNFKAALAHMVYRGHNRIPKDAYSRFSSAVFFAGQRDEEKINQRFRGELSGDFTLIAPHVSMQPLWSNCGEDTILRINTRLSVRTNATREVVNSKLRSIQLGDGINPFLSFKRCEN